MLIPEWTAPSQIALVWPENLPSGVGKLKELYSDLISALLKENVSVNLLFREGKDKSLLKKLFPVALINFIQIPEISDIWIRDFAPFWVKTNSKIETVQQKYKPSYNRTKGEKQWADDNYTSMKIHSKKLFGQKTIPLKVGNNDLILDGGNLVHNGEGLAIISHRLISDNESLFLDETRQALKELLGIKELLLIPCEPGDDTGHVDGLVRFKDSKTVIVSDYPDQYKNEKDNIHEDEFEKSLCFVRKLQDFLIKEGLELIKIRNSIPKIGKYKFESARGNYVNYLRIGQKIFLPRYNLEDDDVVAKKQFIDIFGKDNVIQISSDASALADYGGVFNCIITHIFKHN